MYNLPSKAARYLPRLLPHSLTKNKAFSARTEGCIESLIIIYSRDILRRYSTSVAPYNLPNICVLYLARFKNDGSTRAFMVAFDLPGRTVGFILGGGGLLESKSRRGVEIRSDITTI